MKILMSVDPLQHAREAIPWGGMVRKIFRYAPCSVLVTRPGFTEKKVDA